MAHFVPPSGPARFRLTSGSLAVGMGLRVDRAERVELLVFFEVVGCDAGALDLLVEGWVLEVVVFGEAAVGGAGAFGATTAEGAGRAVTSTLLVTVTWPPALLDPQATAAHGSRQAAAIAATRRVTACEGCALTGSS